MRLFIICISFIVLSASKLSAQIIINEFLASNTGITIDPDFNESSDWIELHNTGASSLPIGGYFLTDNFGESAKWMIPSGVVINAGAYLLIWADGYNTGLHTNFKISATSEELAIFSPSGELIDSISFGLQEPNISMGRKSDGSNEWGYFIEPSPGASNQSETFAGIVQNTPHFSPLGGIFTEPVSLKISNTFGGEIHYTLDGSIPNENSSIVSNPLIINETTIIRTRIYKPGMLPGKVVTHSYFIDSNNGIGSLPVISISSDPSNFWDSQKGIYVQDFKPDWEVPINIELFENDGSDRAGFNLTAGAKINGLYSWQLPQKMLGIYFRKSYGEGKLEYPLFFDRERTVFDSFALRASGSDWAYTLFRDAMIQSLTPENMQVDYQGYRPCVVFINGQYMGIHNIRSKVDEDFIVHNYQLGNQQIDMVENENYAEAGTLSQYNNFKELYLNDLSIQSNYDLVAEKMDIEEFTDFIITEIYSRNTSIDHNIMTWKPQSEGKWKWILMDLDRGFFSPGSTLIDFFEGKDVYPFKQLLKNEGYRNYFGKRLADHLFTTFSSDRVNSIIDKFKANIQNEIPNHIIRWQGTSSDYGDPISSVNYWNSEIDKLKSFTNLRPQALLNDLVNYGFEPSTPLSVTIYPEKAGAIYFNDQKINQTHSEGSYPINQTISLVADAKAGYQFKGWQSNNASLLIGKEEIWKYNDTGLEPAQNWMTGSYSDANWKEGKAELGYGDNDENTVISYGDNSENKHITSYFRKTFTLQNNSSVQELKINLKYDDGAVVYLNGTEVIRENLPSGEINWLTKALSGLSGSSENNFTIYPIDPALLINGENIIAVEVHQVLENSSDLSFDLELTTSLDVSNEFISTDQNLAYTHRGNTSLVAVFESDGSCILPNEITSEVILDKACSPYKVPENVKITSSGKLIIEAGVEILISDDISIEVNGSMFANGTLQEPVIFKSNPDSPNKKWGILNFVNADSSYLSNIIIEDASKGENPIREIAAISAFHSILNIDGAIIKNIYSNPIAARYSDVSLINSKLHSEITGDLINLKYGKGYIDNCEFEGNDMPDTDAIDYDDIEDGVIKNSIIHDFHGFNSDAIDIGEKATNISMENLVVYNITDKGVSVGQQSTASIFNSIFVNCNLGAGLKDSSRVSIDHCTYYGNGISIACFEKNEGDAGGNASVTNSILSNAYKNTYLSDSKSTINISYSASDNDSLPAENSNLFTDPLFRNPNLFDFSLIPGSECMGAGSNGNMGSNLSAPTSNQLYFSVIAYNSDINIEDLEYIVLSNTGSTTIDLTGYKFTKGITFTFHNGAQVKAGQNVYITNNANSDLWLNRGLKVLQWETGRLADEGETIQLETPAGIVVDNVHYNSDSSWPALSAGEGIMLVSDDVDNHFGSNWEAKNLMNTVRVNELINESEIKVFPNPTTGILNLTGLKTGTLLNIFNLSGIKVKSQISKSTEIQIDLVNLQPGIYVIHSGSFSQYVVLVK